MREPVRDYELKAFFSWEGLRQRARTYGIEGLLDTIVNATRESD